MEIESLSQMQVLALLIGWAVSHTFMPMVLYEAWKSHKERKPFEFSSLDCWVFPAFWMSLISIIVTFIFVTLPQLF